MLSYIEGFIGVFDVILFSRLVHLEKNKIKFKQYLVYLITQMTRFIVQDENFILKEQNYCLRFFSLQEKIKQSDVSF